MESMDTKEKVFRALKETDGYLSGEVLSRQLGISRAAVWKAISSLREMGCQIDSVTHRGYRLLGVPDLLTGEALLEGLEDTFVTRICAMKQVDSTNNEAKRQAQLGAPAGSLFVAEEQTGGKGRLGRQWSSPSGTGLWCSLLLRPKAVPEQVTGLTLLAGLAVARSIRALTGLNAQIKWPNDRGSGGPEALRYPDGDGGGNGERGICSGRRGHQRQYPVLPGGNCQESHLPAAGNGEILDAGAGAAAVFVGNPRPCWGNGNPKALLLCCLPIPLIVSPLAGR